MKNYSKTGLFLGITFLISYSAAGIFKLAGGNYQNRAGFMIFGAAYMFIPMISAIIVKKYIAREKLNDLLISFKINKWFFIAWLLMPIIAFCSFGASLLFPGIHYSPEMTGIIQRFESIMTPGQIEQMKNSLETIPFDPFLMTLIQGLIAGLSINAIAGFGEEFGWRGFLLTEFKEMSFAKASLIIGFIWGIWHAPIILMGHNYPQHPKAGVIMMIIVCILLTPLFIYITIKSRSVIAAAIMHGTLNATAGLAILKIEGGNDLITGVTGLAGFLTLLLFIAFMFLYDYFISGDKILTGKIQDHL